MKELEKNTAPLKALHCPICNKATNKMCKNKCLSCYKKEYRQTHKEEIHNYNISSKKRQSNAAYYSKNKDALNKNHYQKYKEYKTQWNIDNSEHRREWKKQYEQKRRECDALYKFKQGIRNNIKDAVKRRTIYSSIKSNRTEEILGCSIDDFISYIESLFQDGMSWDNYGLWHLDHIKPLALATNQDEVYKLCYYTNYQPLWAKDNLTKGDYYIEEEQ